MPLLDPRNVVDAAQQGDVEAGALVARWAGFGTTSAEAMASEVTLNEESPNNDSHADRRALVGSGYRFHENAGTLTPSVSSNLEAFASGAPLVRIGYTPDHFANFTLYGEALFSDQLARHCGAAGRRSAQVVVIIDTEVATDKRSRSSVFPDIKRDGSLLRMTTEIPAYQRQRLARHVDPPHETEILRWMLDLRNSVYGDVRALQRMGIVSTDARAAYRTVRYLQAEALESTRRARSLADFNMIFASRVMNLAWGLPIAFISLTDCVPHMQAAYEQILARYDDMVTSSKTALVSLRERGFFVSEAMHFDPSEFPLWLICECFSRVAMAIRPTAALSITGRCASCGATHSYDLGARASPDLASLCRRLVPRMLFDDLTNPTIWNVAAGISNAGSVRHILPMYETARTLGLEVPPEALLRLRGIYFGPAELRLAAAADELTAPDRAALWRIYWGRASIVYYLVSAGVEGLRDMWRSWFSGSESIAGVNVGVNRFSLEPRQEAWLRSTMNAIPPR